MNLPALAAALHQLADALLEGETPSDTMFTVAELADRLHRSKSTVRGWLEAGRFPEAFKLNQKDWRVPTAALEAFLAGQSPTVRHDMATRPRCQARRNETPDMGAWRKERTGDAA